MLCPPASSVPASPLILEMGGVLAYAVLGATHESLRIGGPPNTRSSWACGSSRQPLSRLHLAVRITHQSQGLRAGRR